MLKKFFNKIKMYRVNRNYKTKIKYLREKGAIIGDGTRLNCKVDAFDTEPYLISVGERCLFATDVNFFTHDGGVSVINNLNYFNGKRMDKMARIKIGDNVYIGRGATICMGVTIGNNCIIGAGAIVTKDIPDNSVAVGVPAKRIKSIDEYYNASLEKGMFYESLGMPPEEKREYLSKNVKSLNNL